MNFVQYQNFINRSASEVPFVTDPRTNILQTLYSQSNDELWIDSWLQQNCIYRPIPKVRVIKGNPCQYIYLIVLYYFLHFNTYFIINLNVIL